MDGQKFCDTPPPPDDAAKTVVFSLQLEEGAAAASAAVDAEFGGRAKRARPIADDPYWRDIHPALRTKVEAIRRRLLMRGWTPCIPAGSARRTLAQQVRLVARGRSKTLRSRHLTGRAVDIVPAYWGWDAPREFWLLLGNCAECEGLVWGGYWGLSARDRLRLREAIATDGAGPRKSAPLGWDTAHVELPHDT